MSLLKKLALAGAIVGIPYVIGSTTLVERKMYEDSILAVPAYTTRAFYTTMNSDAGPIPDAPPIDTGRKFIGLAALLGVGILGARSLSRKNQKQRNQNDRQ